MSQTNKPTACKDFPQAMTRGARSLAGDDVAVHHGFRILRPTGPRGSLEDTWDAQGMYKKPGQFTVQ